MQQTSLPPSILLQATAEAACSPSSIAPPSLNVAAPQAVLSQRARVVSVVGPAHAVSRQDKPQHVTPMLEQPQFATPGADVPQLATPTADQSKHAAQSAAFKNGELNSVTSQTSEPQPVASEVVSRGVAPSSGAAQPQLTTSVEAQPQRAMAHVLDMLFPAEQLPAQLPPSSSPAADGRLPPGLAEHTGAGAAGAAATPPGPAVVTQKPSASLTGTAAMLTADPRAFALPDVASLEECHLPAALHASTAVGRLLPAAPTTVGRSLSAATTAAEAPLAAALHVSMPCVSATSANGNLTDAAAATNQGASVNASSASEPVIAAQVPSYITAVPADVLSSSGASQSAEAAAAAQLAALSHLAQQIAEALAEAAFQLVKGGSKAEQFQLEQQAHDLQPHCQQLHEKGLQQQQTHQLQERLERQQQQQGQETQQQQPKLHEAKQQQPQQLHQQHQKQQQAKQQQQQQQPQGLQKQKQQEQQVMTAASSVELLAALSADKSGVPLAACLAAPTQAPHPGFTFEPALFSMATDTPEAACLSAPASSSVSASSAAAAAVAAAVLLSSSIQAQAGGATRPGIEPWLPCGAFLEVGLQAPPVRSGPPPVRAGPPAPGAMPPPPVAGPQLPAWTPHQPLRYWGQPPPAQPTTQYQQLVIAPLTPLPGPPPPQPAAGQTPLAPPPLPSGSSRLPSRPHKRKAPAQQQRPAAKRQMPLDRRAPRRADSAGSVGSVHSNSCSEAKGEDAVGSSSPSRRPPSKLVPVRLCDPPLLGTGSRLGPGKHSRRRLRHKSKLAECAQEAYARASGKAIPAAPAIPGGPQRNRGQPPKTKGKQGKGKQGKGKGPSYKPSQIHKGRVGFPRAGYYAPLRKYPK
ncbi:hypothetical protein ABBQ32_012344 [Trebouxia sp. C0010 RCD-2024]